MSIRPLSISLFCMVLIAGVSAIQGSAIQAQEFQRGNCNNDCTLDISDPIFHAQRLFQGGAAPACAKACDSNDDGQTNIADIIATLSALFGVPSIPLPPPYLACGTDPTPDALSCVASSCGALQLAPADLEATIQGGMVILTWTNADPCTGLTSVRIVRTLNVPPTGPMDPAATEVFQGPAIATAHSLTELLPNTTEIPRTYYYAAYGCASGNSCSLDGSVTTLTPTLIQCLQAGGYTIYFRHGLATTCSDRTDLGTAANTTEPGWWTSCDPICPPTGNATARQIDAGGVVQATTVGLDMTARGVPVGRVLSSEFCRCVTTADLMGFAPATETNQGITFFVYSEAGRCASALALLSEVPAAGTNTIMVGHVGMTCQLLGTLAVAEGMVYKPDGQGGSVYLTRVPFDQWLAQP